jgi:hypothetical protein
MTAETTPQLDNSQLAQLVDDTLPATRERLRSLFEAISNVVVIKPSKTNWVYELGDFDDDEGPERTWIQPGMIAEGSVTTIVAKTAHGKSLFCLKLAQAITDAQELFGYPHRRRAVLYLDRENKLSTLKNRRDWLGVKIRGKRNPNSLLWYCSSYQHGLKEPSDAFVLEWATLQELPPVIVVDTLRGHLKKGKKENLTEDIREFYGQFNKLLAMGCAVVVLHHTGKGESTKEGSGSEDIHAVSDYVFKIKNVTRDSAGKISAAVPIKKMAIERLKSRDVCELWDETVYLDIADDGSFTIGEAAKSKESNVTTVDETATVADSDKLKAIVKANPGVLVATFEAMAKEQGIGQGVARKWRMSSISDGSIVKWLGVRNAIHLYLPGVAPAEQAVSSEGLLPAAEGS